LIDERSFDLDWKNAAEVELPGSRSLQVTPRQLDADGKIKVHLELLGEHPAHTRKLHTDYAIQRGGTILVGGIRVDPRDEKAGKLARRRARTRRRSRGASSRTRRRRSRGRPKCRAGSCTRRSLRETARAPPRPTR